MMKYKFDEDRLIDEFKNYVDSTYGQHYATDKYQATDIIIDSGHGTGFCLGNVIKYSKRYGKKGSADDHRRDIMKVLHYALIQLYIHDQAQPVETQVVQRELNLDLPNPVVNDDVDWNHAPTLKPQLLTEVDTADKNMHNKSIDDASPEEWDNVAKKLRGRREYPYPSEL
jgi:hypothetical protein